MSQSRSLAISRFKQNQLVKQDDAVALEEPLEIRIAHPRIAEPRGRALSITMRTPGHDFSLALGFLYGEGLISGASDVRSMRSCGIPDPRTGRRNTVMIELAPELDFDMQSLQRHFYTTSSCGVCGKSSLEALSLAGSPSLHADPIVFSATMLQSLPGSMRKRQHVFERTGGIHASALFDAHGEITRVAEDVGRHNALDKIVGSLLQDQQLPATGHGLLVSGRASFELLQKALRAGIPLVAAVGAPSSLAIEVAQEFGMTLIGFLGRNRFNIYSGEQRVKHETSY